MITVCTGCQARYRLDATKVPARLIRVRCPACAIVFDLDGTRRADSDMPAQEPQPGEFLDFGVEPAPDISVTEPAPPAQEEPQPPLVSSIQDELAAPAPRDAAVEPADQDLPREQAAAVVDRASEPAPAPAAEPASPGRRRRREKTEMLARALVSDILVYNQAARDKALVEGTLLEVLGPEIKKSWQLFKERVGTEAATSTTYFKDALNEILAEGQKVF